MFHVLQEGSILYDDGLVSSTSRNYEVSTEDLLLQWRIAKSRAESLGNLSVYGNIFVDPLSRLYPLAKKICILALAFRGEFLFNRHSVYYAMIREFPDLADNLRELYGLRPFAIAWKRPIRTSLPFAPVNCRRETERLRDLLKQVIDRVEQNEPKIHRSITV